MLFSDAIKLEKVFNDTPAVGLSFAHHFSFTREQILVFAEISGDTNPVHVSSAYGQESRFGECIVHGYFSISIFSKVYGTLLFPEGHILINQSARYIKPVYTNKSYLAYFQLKEIIKEKNRAVYENHIYDPENNNLLVLGEATLLNLNYYK